MLRRGTGSKVAKELEAILAVQYESLNDAAVELGDVMSFTPGSTEIWYMKPSEFRDWSMGYDWLVEHGALPALSLRQTHVLLGTVRERSPDVIYGMMQGEKWSPRGQARSLIQRKGLGHTSMSVGDIIGISGRFWLVDNAGFKELV